MAGDDLAKAYRSGTIGRRAFVRGLVALGMTVTAANLMADGAEAAPKKRKRHKDDVYGTPAQRITKKIVKSSPALPPRINLPIVNPRYKNPYGR